MSNLFEFKVTEFKHNQIALAIDTLKQLPLAVIQKIERTGLRKSLRPVYEEVLRRVPVGATGNLKKGIKLRVKKYGTIIRGEVVSLAQHSHLVELGHRIIKGKKGGAQKSYGVVEEHPFFRPAFHGKEEQVMNLMAEEVQAAIAKYEKKTGSV